MLERITINGFRALSKVDVPLKPLTVLIGQNDSGKSSFLEGIRWLLTLDQPASLFDHRSAVVTNPIEIQGFLPNRQTIKKVSEKNHSGPASVETVTPLESYVLPSVGVPMLSHGIGAGAVPLPGKQGQQIAAILDSLLRTDRKRFDEIESVIRAHLPGVEALSIETPDASQRRVDLVFQGGLKMPAATRTGFAGSWMNSCSARSGSIRARKV